MDWRVGGVIVGVGLLLVGGATVMLTSPPAETPAPDETPPQTPTPADTPTPTATDTRPTDAAARPTVTATPTPPPETMTPTATPTATPTPTATATPVPWHEREIAPDGGQTRNPDVSATGTGNVTVA